MGRLIEHQNSASLWPLPGDPVEMRISRTETWTVRIDRGLVPAPLRHDLSNVPVLIDQRPLPWRRSRRAWDRIALALAIPLAAIAGVATWIGLTPAPPPAAPSRVEIDLPPPPPSVPPVREVVRTIVVRSAAPRPVVAPPVAPRERAPTGAEPLALDDLPEVQAALRRTIATGAAEPWAAAGLSGYAVTSPVQIDEDRACRNVAIWAEAENAAGKAINRRLCLTDGGAWTLVD